MAKKKKKKQNTKGRGWIVFISVVGVIVIGIGALFALSQRNVRDWDALKEQYKVEEPEPEITPEPFFTPYESEEETEPVDYVYDAENVVDIYVFSSSPQDDRNNFHFEYKLVDDKVLFTCRYTDEDGTLFEFEDREIQKGRFEEPLKIINNFTITEMINNYRAGRYVTPVPFEQKEGSLVEDRGVMLTWSDGDSLKLGYPKGAGNALVKYFKEMAVWLYREEK